MIKRNTFRKIPSLKFLYEINPYGIIRNTKSKKILRHQIDKDGYHRVQINTTILKKKPYIHRLVAECYVKNPFNYSVINHKDENKANNYYKNLEWCTTKYNNSYGNRLKKCSETMANKNDFIYYAKEFDKYFNTSKEAGEYIKNNFPEYTSSLKTIMRNIRTVSENRKKVRYKTTWKRIFKNAID